eukprot:Gregarina_sp_Poly_1__10825@NODE_836_length_6052_cov_95_155221_g604_i0_p1_GENE_NODE_836_length_6052_cov_95_155221_g604_i0NODE_836_length_6052_cov_95_155221_g604_i0_p1_ORF_typecomplete_len736_score73_50Neur_chan_LBD/PF02931_23/1_1e05Neur_chan_memb/PF02932_16/0_00047Neur_chan_memb/PF02932_16/1_1e02_NODE_836_length_6052_cov_95_155221_g604_i09623169
MRPRIYDSRFLKSKGYNVVWMRTMAYRSECLVHLEAFPFDDQVCSLIFLDEIDQLLHLTYPATGDPAPARDQFATNQEFYEIRNLSWIYGYNASSNGVGAYGAGLVSSAQFFFLLKRKAHFYILNFVWPLILTVTFSYLSFWLPFEWFDRVSLTVTICTAIFDIVWLIMELRPAVASEAWIDGLQSKCIMLTALPAVETIILSHVVGLLRKWELNEKKQQGRMKRLWKQLQEVEISKAKELLTRREWSIFHANLVRLAHQRNPVLWSDNNSVMDLSSKSSLPELTLNYDVDTDPVSRTRTRLKSHFRTGHRKRLRTFWRRRDVAPIGAILVTSTSSSELSAMPNDMSEISPDFSREGMRLRFALSPEHGATFPIEGSSPLRRRVTMHQLQRKNTMFDSDPDRPSQFRREGSFAYGRPRISSGDSKSMRMASGDEAPQGARYRRLETRRRPPSRALSLFSVDENVAEDKGMAFRRRQANTMRPPPPRDFGKVKQRQFKGYEASSSTSLSAEIQRRRLRSPRRAATRELPLSRLNTRFSASLRKSLSPATTLGSVAQNSKETEKDESMTAKTKDKHSSEDPNLESCALFDLPEVQVPFSSSLPYFIDRLMQISFPGWLAAAFIAQSGVIMGNWREILSSMSGTTSASSAVMAWFFLVGFTFMWTTSLYSYLMTNCKLVSPLAHERPEDENSINLGEKELSSIFVSQSNLNKFASRNEKSLSETTTSTDSLSVHEAEK